MSNLTGKVLRSFTHKGKDYKEGDEISLKPLVAGKYEKAGRITLTKTDVKTVEAVNEKLAEKMEKVKVENYPATNVVSTKTPVKTAKKK